MNYFQLNKMNFSKYRTNFSSEDDGTFWPGVVELPIEDNNNQQDESNSSLSSNPRLFTAVALLIVLTIFFTNKNAAFLLLIFAVFIAAKEWFDMFDYGIIIPYPFLLYSSIAPMLIVYFFNISLIYVSFFIFPIGLIVYTGSFISYGIYEKFGSVFIYHIWFSLGITSIVYVLKSSTLLFTYFAIISISLSDTLAYEVGRRFGKKKLIEHISPNKTVEGLIAGLVSGTLAMFLNLIFNTETTSLRALVISLIFIGFGVLGDLFVSKIKRTLSVKDSSSLLPGHGGLLDRVDSYLLSFPVLLLFSQFSYLIP
ncbi:phosphatidate cytidylyltransferase [Acidimicrobiia bacterium]|nr:phosphatidate cytidylyltransferase [Acidimicrobiia bacterium]MDB0017226.1 phosphatidate cytidylyltransferase [Acidimicrobiia bacterium]MDB3866260.1 phosphatidate cytidylyltransferase [Acidimicrobiia bacterium]MDB4855924.1 phosphatidate cytidylyltransferase [Acidimicrobiia bacterium]MDC3277150.1 phosphatidate cytidylyltransferase [Acidimicrobiia bacterium]